jgi:nucleoside-diphosphate kinase
MKEQTFSFLKPDVSMIHSEEIFEIIKTNGFIVLEQKKTFITKQIAESFFYSKKKNWEKNLYQKYIDFMMSGPIIAFILEKEFAISDFRKLMGDDPDPLKNPENSIRRKLGSYSMKNAIHGSRSPKKFDFESSHFFGSAQVNLAIRSLSFL